MNPLEQGNKFIRVATIDARRIDEKKRTVPASLSSETEVQRYYGTEVLVHSDSAIDLTRANGGLPLIWNHDLDEPIGLVDDVHLDGGVLRGNLRFSNNPQAEIIWNDVRQGFLKNISIGYQVNQWEEQPNSDLIRVTGWTLLETSVVTVPADATVGINRKFQSIGIRSMADEKTSGTDVVPSDPPIPVYSPAERRDHKIAKEAGKKEAIVGERKRISDIHELFDLAIVPRNDYYDGLRSRAIDEGWTIESSRVYLMQALSDEAEPVVVDHAPPVSVRPAQHEGQSTRAVQQPARNQPRQLGASIQSGMDAREKFANGAQEGLLIRAGIITDREAIAKARAGGMIGKSLNSLAGEFLRVIGESTVHLSDEDMAIRAYAYRSERAFGQTTSDFTNILANVANKSMMMGWDESPETWKIWTRRGQLPDFKTAEISGISGFTGLDAVPEDGDISYGKFIDRKETIKLVQYAKKYRLSRQAIINDDLRHFTAVPRAMGRAAQAKIGDVVYALLNNTGPTLNQDSIALWDTATHKNYVAAATGPTVATLGTASVAMARQKDPNSSRVLNIRPRYLLVPITLEATARVLMNATYDPAGTAGTLPPNPYSGRFEVIADARLDEQTNGTTAWYLLGDPGVYDTVEVAFLNGVQEPYMRENPDWAGQGMEYAVGVDFGVSVLDYRAMHKYKGNT